MQEEAKKLYVELVESLLRPERKDVSGITVNVEDGVRLITFNRPEKRNAINTEVSNLDFAIDLKLSFLNFAFECNYQMYLSITDALVEANSDDDTRIVAMTGTGSYFSSGHDLASFANATDFGAIAAECRVICR